MRAEEVRNNFGEVIDHALRGQPTTVTRWGREAAVIVSADWYREACEALGETGRLGAAE